MNSDEILNERTHLLRHDSPSVSNGISYETKCFEPPAERKARWRSIRLMYMTMFLSSVTFTISMSSLWPYLQLVDQTATAEFLGWVVAGYSIGQLIASPLFGFWSNHWHTTRWPLIVSIFINICANIMYGYIESFNQNRKFYLLLARVLVGFGAGNVAVVRSYVAGATSSEERTPVMANISIFQSSGFILGPGFQAALVPLGYPGPIHVVGFHLDLYTAPAFISAVAGILNIILLLTIFKETRVQDLSTLSIQNSDTIEIVDDHSPDYLAVISSIIIFFVVLFIFTIFETIGSPLLMDMYGWSKTQATLYQGIILVGAGCEAIVVSMFLKPLAKRFNERKLLLFGFIMCLGGYFIFLPWGNELPVRSVATLKPANNFTNVTVAYMTNYTTDSTFVQHHLENYDGSIGEDYSMSADITLLNNATTNGTTISTTHITKTSLTTSDTSKFSDGTSSISIETTTEDTPRTSIGSTPPYITNSSIYSQTTIKSTTEPPTTSASVSSHTTDNATTTMSPQTTSSGAMFTNTTDNTTTTTVEPQGCPVYYDWCSYTPVIYLSQFLVGVAFIGVGYPISQIMSYTLYSKILGPKPQAVWMGWLTAAGSGARAIGPVFVTQIYNSYGPRVTFSACCGILLLTVIFVIVIFKKLVPFSLQSKLISPVRNSPTN